MQPSLLSLSPTFDGPDVSPSDQVRLSAHLLKLTKLMADQEWRTLAAIAAHVGCTEASASARLRDLRKPRFGSFHVERRRLIGGVWLYRVTA